MSTESAPPDLVAQIDALLPQTQCTRCGYSACRPYAAAMAGGEAPINQCPPGGAATIRALANLLGRAVLPLNPANGIEAPPRVAWIDESQCIGCARCLPPCPVDAIIGAAKYMHTVMADRCTGCELCIAPCPVDCIEMRPRYAPTKNPEIAPRGLNQPGLNQPGLNQPGLNQPGLIQPGLIQPGLIQPGLIQPGLIQPGLIKPGLIQPGLIQPGLIQPGLDQPEFNQADLNETASTQAERTQADLNRARFMAHTERLQRRAAARQRELAAKKASAVRNPA